MRTVKIYLAPTRLGLAGISNAAEARPILLCEALRSTSAESLS